MDCSTCPYHQSRIPCRPIHRHGPSAVPKAIPRDNQVADLYYLQSRDTDETSQLLPLRTSQTRGLRHETQLQLNISRLVTGLVTVNGNRKFPILRHLQRVSQGVHQIEGLSDSGVRLLKQIRDSQELDCSGW